MMAESFISALASAEKTGKWGACQRSLNGLARKNKEKIVLTKNL
jgi:hypothetical protein